MAWRVSITIRFSHSLVSIGRPRFWNDPFRSRTVAWEGTFDRFFDRHGSYPCLRPFDGGDSFRDPDGAGQEDRCPLVDQEMAKRFKNESLDYGIAHGRGLG